MKQNNFGNLDFFFENIKTKKFWKFRKECLWSAMSQYPDHEPMITDVCVPLTKLPDLIHNTKERIAQSNLPCPIIAHAGN